MDKQKQKPASDASRTSRARAALLRWHRKHGRHGLPWRGNHSPYAVLVSEFMLQQTTVATVMPRFETWMRLFPDIKALAAAQEQAVLAAWEGLGYYSRARRLHAAAQAIIAHHGGIIPATREELLSLPGVGEYTAAAILAFAHDRQAVVLDTNIIRVLARWANLRDPVDATGGRKELEKIATGFFPSAGCRAVASALMDLGAMICTSGKPDCPACPLRETCRASSPELLPVKSPRRVTTKVTEHRVWHLHGEKLSLEQSEGPRWKGLWILPELGKGKPAGRAIAELTYPITRYRVTMKLFPVKGPLPLGTQGFTREKLAKLPVPTPHRKAIEKAFRAIAAK